jgi:hypothetical protein
MKNHTYLQNEINHQRHNEKDFKHNLGNEYNSIVEEKKRKMEE